jgi:type VI secretion system protein ImpK
MMTGSEQTLHSNPTKATEESTSAAPAIPFDTSTQQQLMLPSQFVTHHPKAGLNPLVDAAAYLFSIIGKLKLLKSYRNLSKLHQELLQEMNAFQDTAKAQGYTSEYILVSRYALCATIDDMISNTPWGSQGQWDSYSLLATLNQESTQQDRFFIILDRIIKEPVLYIDVMELMYMCLSLGYKGSYRSTEFSHNQLDQIINALYKRIRAQRGDFSKSLSPFPIRPHAQTYKTAQKKIPIWQVVIVTLVIIFGLFIGLGYCLDFISNQAYQELLHIGKSILYEATNT